MTTAADEDDGPPGRRLLLPLASELALIQLRPPPLPAPTCSSPSSDSPVPARLRAMKPLSSRMLPRSLPYAGGGASVPMLGASPHFLTLASMKTKPAWPRLT